MQNYQTARQHSSVPPLIASKAWMLPSSCLGPAGMSRGHLGESQTIQIVEKTFYQTPASCSLWTGRGWATAVSLMDRRRYSRLVTLPMQCSLTQLTSVRLNRSKYISTFYSVNATTAINTINFKLMFFYKFLNIFFFFSQSFKMHKFPSQSKLMYLYFDWKPKQILKCQRPSLMEFAGLRHTYVGLEKRGRHALEH